MKFYVYRHIRPDKNTPFNVGKGHGRRAYSKHRNRYWHNIAGKYGYRVEIVKYFNNEQEAFTFERKLIRLYKSFGYCEANMTDGGEGSTGLKHSDTTRLKMSKSQKGKKKSLEHRQRIAKSTIGHKRNVGKRHSRKTLLKMSRSQKGRIFSEESRKKMSESQKGVIPWNKGIPRREETKRKISETKKLKRNIA